MWMDLNCDMGEAFGVYPLGADEQVMPFISSANVACGFHAGDSRVMRRTVRLAADHGVGIGAHVSYRDLVGFGRREIQMDPGELEGDVLYQIGALHAFCRAEGTAVRHVKPHGALYNQAMRDDVVAAAIARAVAAFDPGLILFAQPGSAMERAATAAGLSVAVEFFADRGYTPEGALADRRLPGAVIPDPQLAAARVIEMMRHGRVIALDGSVVPLQADTICVHGDTPDAVLLLRQIRQELNTAGIHIAPVGSRAARCASQLD